MISLDLSYETKLWDQGHKYICGIDEVGRGAFCGPLVVACVGFSSDVIVPTELIVQDSKVLTQKQKNEAYIWIIENCLFYGLGQVENTYIDRYGILQALYEAKQIAFDRAKYILTCNVKHAEINRVMIDGNDNQVLEGIPATSQINLIRGDSQIFTIACASIVAKVHRDALMHTYSLHPKFRVYDWSSNKGYGTKSHINAIKCFGISGLHRRQYVRKYVSE